jgi:MFS family permease
MPDTPRRGSLLVIFLTVFIDLLGFGIVLPLLPIYAEQFAHHFTPEQMGWVIGLLMSSFSAMQFLFAPLWGRLSDRIGRRPVLMIGLAGSVVFYALFGVASIFESLTLLFVARIGAGIAGATIPTAQAYIADTTTLEGRTKGMALIGAAFGIGFTFGPLFGYLAVPSEGSAPGPGPGYAAAALSAVALVLAWFRLPESLSPERAAASAHGGRGWGNLFHLDALLDAFRTPSIGLLLLASFICVFSFANFESTLSRILFDEHGVFRFSFREVCLTFAYVGCMLTLVQGGIVRRLSGHVPDAALATTGAVVLMAGLAMLAQATGSGSLGFLLAALGVSVAGFALLTPALNALISRRSHPARQGGILGVAQSVSSLARIVGPVAGNRLFENRPAAPLWLAVGMMGLGVVLVVLAAGRGRDFQA